MSGLTVHVLFQDIKKVETDALVVGFYEDVRPLKGIAGQLDWLLCGALSSLVIENKMSGALGDVALLTARGKVPAQKIFMIGLGRCADYSLAILRQFARNSASSVLGAGVARAAIEYLQPPETPSDKGIPALREGLLEGAGGRSLAVSLLAPDAATYEELSRLMKA
jgi:hypothetical protein